MKLFYKILGLTMVALGVLGIALPVLPTTPFLLVAAWAFGRSSERLRRWLLGNRLFGGYLRNYRSGRGIPLKIRIWTLSLLWVTIGISAWRVDPLWLKIILPCIAAAVTAHVWHLGRRRVLVLVPTAKEAVAVRQVVGNEGVVICGVGMAEVAAAVVHVISKKPRMLILAGVAGAFEGEIGLCIGDCVAVLQERIAGIPYIYNRVYDCPWASQAGLPLAVGVTVSRTEDGISAADAAVGSDVADGSGDNARDNATSTDTPLHAIENMEGAAFFAACQAAGVKFLEIRAISNMVGAPRSEWRVDEAAVALAEAVRRFFNEMEL